MLSETLLDFISFQHSRGNRSCSNSQQATDILFISILSSHSCNKPGRRYTELCSNVEGFDPFVQLSFSRFWTVQTADASLCRSLCYSNGLCVTRLPVGTY